MMEESVQQEDTMIEKVYKPSSRPPPFIKHTLLNQKGKIG
jgi:hypothetical protein